VAKQRLFLFGINLPALITENKPLAETIEEVHETAGTVGYYLIRIHALAGLFHHYVQRDNTLRRMLPKLLPSQINNLGITLNM
jgi:cytochrome b561